MNHQGRLLVATPLIGDPNFHRTVVLVLAHGDEGALGVVLNRPSLLPVRDVVPGWCAALDPPAVVFFGGPCGEGEVIGLAGGRFEASRRVQELTPGLATVDLGDPPGAGDPVPEHLRLFAGSAGWAPGQLEDEVAEGAWWSLDPGEGDVFGDGPDDLWARVLKRQRGPRSWFANCPTDPSAN